MPASTTAVLATLYDTRCSHCPQEGRHRFDSRPAYHIRDPVKVILYESRRGLRLLQQKLKGLLTGLACLTPNKGQMEKEEANTVWIMLFK